MGHRAHWRVSEALQTPSANQPDWNSYAYSFWLKAKGHGGKYLMVSSDAYRYCLQTDGWVTWTLYQYELTWLVDRLYNWILPTNRFVLYHKSMHFCICWILSPNRWTERCEHADHHWVTKLLCLFNDQGTSKVRDHLGINLFLQGQHTAREARDME